MAWNPMPAKTLQVFAGGKADLDPYAKTVFTSNCGCIEGSLTYDRIMNPLQFDRGLNHLSPLGGRETFEFGGNPQRFISKQIVEHINREGVGARIEIIALPTAAILKFLAVSVYQLDPGLTFQFTTRNGHPLPTTTGTKLTVPVEPECNPNITEASIAAGVLNSIGAPTATSRSEHYVYRGEAFAGNSDVLTMVVVTMPTAGTITLNNYLQVDVGYEVPVRLY